jgi:hypothetical protein
MVCLPFTSLQKNIINKIFCTRSSFHPQPRASGHMCVHVYQRTRVASERRTGWSNKLLEIFKTVVLSWVYKLIDMKYSRWGGTKVWFHARRHKLKWSSAAMGAVKSIALVATMIEPACQWLNVEMSVVTTSAHCYCGLLFPRTEYFHIVSHPHRTKGSTTKWANYYT